MAMGEMVVSSVVSVLIEKLISGPLMNFAQQEGIDNQLKKWKNDLGLIQDVLVDAANKHITQKAVRSWLNDLQELAYDMEDVVDDIATEVTKRELNRKCDPSTSRKLFKSVHGVFTHSVYGRNVRSKLEEVTNRLNELLDQKNKLGLEVYGKFETLDNSNRRLETSLIDESKVLGREGDKEALLEKILGGEASNQNVSIVPIVGLGGVGKTTLAKLVYNDKKVKGHFELRAWVCVSDVFDIFSISKAIYQSVTGEDKTFANLDLLHVALKEKLSLKRFLIVMDDVWNEEYKAWETLEQPLVGLPGSKIIVTTRKMTVASVMTSVQPHILKPLSDEYAMSLFSKYALGELNFENHMSLKPFAQGIIEKCDGLPLALIALGRVLKTKGNDEDEWEKLLNSEIWSLDVGSDHILPALKLSYYDLPCQLKQLFAYCCLFPKDYVFDKNELVLLWMAEGFLNSAKGNMSMESLGCRYFEELQSRSFFQHSVDSESEYIMHDLMNDLAISVAGEFFYMLDEKMDLNGRNEAFEKFRHFSFIRQKDAHLRSFSIYRKFKELHRATHLRTFLPVSVSKLHFKYMWEFKIGLDNVLVDLLPKLQSLRVLNLSYCNITEVPMFIGNLKHIRYLNFSGTSIKRLPEQVGELYNLQSLLVRECGYLASLPFSFVKLINLRHLDFENTPLLKKTPLGIGELTQLQTLPKVFIEGGSGFNLSELKDLVDLKGELSIEGLEKVMDPIQAKDANLQQKKGLDDIVLEWTHVFDDSRNMETEYEVLEWLRPHHKLKKLKILFYGGVKFPTWVGDPSFNQLRELTFNGCRSCTQLTTGHGKNARIGSFPQLVKLHLTDFPKLAEVSFGFLPSLEVLHMEGCPKLAKLSIGSLPLLEVLNIEGCSEEVLRSIICASYSIRKLKMTCIEGLTKLDGDVLKHLKALEYLYISRCDELRYLCDSESKAYGLLVSLQKLYVSGCNKLVSMGEKEEVSVIVGSNNIDKGSVLRYVTLWGCNSLKSYNCPNSVVKLEIYHCDSLTSLILGSMVKKVDLASSLKSLVIWYCKNLKSFSHEHLQGLTCLEKMNIYNCPSIDGSFPCGLWPPNLRKLEIGELKKPMSKWGLQNYPTSLVQLTLWGKDSGVKSFAMKEDAMNNSNSTSFLLPPSLTSLNIYYFKDVKSFTEFVQHLTHLQQLEICWCPNIKDVPKTTPSLKVTVHM
ncbi:putative disease resistance RPP13-like protein 1 [Rutidosis leptorrhynchoides]|uniref:putative disease resistance RPP13-like protein 1 n=1 Tax=Rutidosis leptorrhynchoides TaxID=125765 RepID=UPI003A997A5E